MGSELRVCRIGYADWGRFDRNDARILNLSFTLGCGLRVAEGCSLADKSDETSSQDHHGQGIVGPHSCRSGRPSEPDYALWHRLADGAIMGYHWEAEMTDVLIRDVPDDVIAALDAHAGRLGLSRSEYVRRRLAQDAATPGSPVSVQDLARFAEVFGDLADPDVMSRAWH